MFLTVIFLVGALGHLSNGVPLEDRSANFDQFFDSRIVGGTEAARGSAPHMAALIVGHIWQSFICGGSIITPRNVMTAAHCITSFIQWNGNLLTTFHAKVGSNIWNSGTVVEFEGYRNHPDYDPWLIKNDIGILITSKPIELNKAVAIISLQFDWVEGGEKCSVNGWGTTRLGGIAPEELQTLSMYILTPEKCLSLNQHINEQHGVVGIPIDSRIEMCTLHPAGAGFGMCHGDSGSAVIQESTKKQVAIVSWGRPCALGAPDVHVRVGPYKGFIYPVIKSS